MASAKRAASISSQTYFEIFPSTQLCDLADGYPRIVSRQPNLCRSRQRPRRQYSSCLSRDAEPRVGLLEMHSSESENQASPRLGQ